MKRFTSGAPATVSHVSHYTNTSHFHDFEEPTKPPTKRRNNRSLQALQPLYTCRFVQSLLFASYQSPQPPLETLGVKLTCTPVPSEIITRNYQHLHSVSPIRPQSVKSQTAQATLTDYRQVDTNSKLTTVNSVNLNNKNQSKQTLRVYDKTRRSVSGNISVTKSCYS